LSEARGRENINAMNGVSRLEPIKVGIIGYGSIGRIHALAYQSIPLYSEGKIPVRLTGVCSTSPEKRRLAMATAGFQWATPDYRELLASPEVDVVSICVPNHLHREIVTGALEAGKHTYAEKPLALNLGEAAAILEQANRSGVRTGMAFVYRFVPAVMRAKAMLDAGMLGRIYHFRMAYYRSKYIDPEIPATWRLQQKYTGGGALADLGSHVIDMALCLLGEITTVRSATETFIPARRAADDPSRMVAVDVDDYALVQLRLKNGAVGTIETSRFATGSTNEVIFEIRGSKGALKFNMTDPNYLYYYDAAEAAEPCGGMSGFKAIQAIQRYPDCHFVDPVSESGWVRYHIASLHYFLQSILEGTGHQPDIQSGYDVQKVLEAAYRSAERQDWVEV
jgi:predicted dehydrogenase